MMSEAVPGFGEARCCTKLLEIDPALKTLRVDSKVTLVTKPWIGASCGLFGFSFISNQVSHDPIKTNKATSIIVLSFDIFFMIVFI